MRQVALGILFWLAFAPAAILGILCLPIGILIYALGNENIRAWVYRSGKALDDFDAACYFGGNGKETISSLTGRYILSGKPLPLKFRFVRWLTDKFEQDHCVKAIEKPFQDAEL